MKNFLFFINLLWCFLAYSQSTANSSAEIYDDLLRLQNNTTVMYLAAHPDDENTRLISWLTHQKHVDAVYLSLTRGDGGQNLIGTEKGKALGLLRTQELLEARKVDKGRQWFSRALDFGYSKTATETFQIWDKQKLLSDVVWAIRKNQPEIIITRFSPDSNGKTHGHHTASAVLAMEAFDLAADKNAFPEQLKFVEPWQVKRMFFNTSWWFYGSQEKFEEEDKSDMVTVDVGTYYPSLGTSNNEISAKSRSKHACQGFGMALERGSQEEYLQYLKGSQPKNNDLFYGINLQWDNASIQKIIDKTIQEFDFKNPQNSLASLLKIYQLAEKGKVNENKLDQIKNLILKTQGIYLEWTTKNAFGTLEQSIETQLEIANRSSLSLNYSISGEGNQTILPNSSKKEPQNFIVNQTMFSNPYWLDYDATNSLFVIENQQEIGRSQIFNSLSKKIVLDFGSVKIPFEIPLQQKTVDSAIGETYEPFYVVPAFTGNFEQDHYIFNNQPKTISVEVKSYVANSSVKIGLKANENWKISEPQGVTFDNSGEKKQIHFLVTPLRKNANSELIANIEYKGKKFSKSLTEIDYKHIDRQIWIKEAKAEVKNVDMLIPEVSIAYLQGSGDDVPNSLRQIGLKVDELDWDNWDSNSLKKYDVLMIGIRAFNTQSQLQFINKDIWNYIENGGTVIVQYQTNRGLITNELAPFELKLGRSRIAEENAELKILNRNHAVVSFPNLITKKDFDDWVQERGLYFADDWDKNLIPILEGNDSGESPQKGILLVGTHGKGTYIFTGLSFFRELPAGVSGAYRLLMNMLSYGVKKDKNLPIPTK